MTQTDKINYLENKVSALERQVEFISRRFNLLPDENELDQAIAALMDSRDPQPLDDYMRRGGKIPDRRAA